MPVYNTQDSTHLEKDFITFDITNHKILWQLLHYRLPRTALPVINCCNSSLYSGHGGLHEVSIPAWIPIPIMPKDKKLFNLVPITSAHVYLAFHWTLNWVHNGLQALYNTAYILLHKTQVSAKQIWVFISLEINHLRQSAAGFCQCQNLMSADKLDPCQELISHSLLNLPQYFLVEFQCPQPQHIPRCTCTHTIRRGWLVWTQTTIAFHWDSAFYMLSQLLWYACSLGQIPIWGSDPVWSRNQYTSCCSHRTDYTFPGCIGGSQPPNISQCSKALVLTQ